MATEQGGRDLGDGILAVGFWSLILAGWVILEPILRGGAGMYECLKALAHARLREVQRPQRVSLKDSASVCLPRVGAVCGEVEDPVRFGCPHCRADSLRVAEGGLVDGKRRADIFQAPGVRSWTKEQVDIVAFKQK